MDNILIRRLISDAHSRLEKATQPDSKKKKRTAKELQEFLVQVKSELQRFNIPIPGTAIDMPSDPPKGIAWAVKVAMCNQDKEPGFVEFVRQQGQSDVYLAAIALSSPETDDHGEIRALQAALDLLEGSAFSTRQKRNAEQPRSPFRALVLDVLKKNPDDTNEEIWVRLQGLHGADSDTEFNGEKVNVDMDFIIPDTKNKKRKLMESYVEWNINNEEPERFERRSLDSLISKLRGEHGISKSI